MMQSSNLASLLARESELVRHFIASLKSEQEALKLGEVDLLSSINADKMALVEQLNTVEIERNSLLRRVGLSGDRDGMQAYLARNTSNAALTNHWATLMDLAHEARELNNLNGKLIAMRLQATNQALATLTHESQRNSLYGRDGHTATRTGSRIIDAA